MDNNQSASTEFKQLIAKGKEQGYLTVDEINDLIPPDIISGDQLSVFIQTFIDMGITVCDTPPETDDLLLNGGASTDSEDVEIVANQLDSSVDIGRTTDPVRMYMREMGNVSLLTRKDEIEISKRIEKGTSDVQMCLVEYPMAMEELFARYEMTLDPMSEIKLGDIINGFSDPTSADDTVDDVDEIIDENAEAELDKELEAMDEADEVLVEESKSKGKKSSKKDKIEEDDLDDEDADDGADSP
ncbi:MAG: RNA polymerase sigma factor region1.1 domain-containing protein, partial [Succinivibrio sp.]